MSLSARWFALTMFLVLSSCDYNGSFLPSSSEGSSSEEISSSASSGESSSDAESSSSSSSSSFSLEIPAEGESIDGMASAWPSHIIEAVFTVPARLTVPSFASTTYLYEYWVNPEPAFAIVAMTSASDPEAVYTESLISAGWTIHNEIIPLIGFPVAVDADEELMISYMANSGAIIINITLLDPDFFIDLGLYESDTWPSTEINAYLENDGADIVVAFPSDAPYYYILPTEDNNVFFIMTQATKDEFDAYLTTMMNTGWGIEQPDATTASIIDPNGKFTLFLGYGNGNVTMVIALSDSSEEPDIHTSSSWPADAVAEFLVPSFVKIPIPSFEASQYYYFFDADEYSPFLSIFAEYNTSLIADYMSAAIAAGWSVYPMHENAGNGYYAVDPDFEIILAFEEVYPYFTLTMWVFDAQLEYYFESGMAAWEYSQAWPSDAIDTFLSETPTTGIPPFSADFYSYRIEYDLFGPYFAIMTNGSSADLDAYQQALISASYHITTQVFDENLYTIAWDTEQTVMIFFTITGTDILFAIRDYDASLIAEQPPYPPADTMTWPSSDIGAEFGPDVPGMIPILSSSFGYLVESSSIDEMAYIFITAIGVTSLEMSYYLEMLANQQYEVKAAVGLATEGFSPYLAVDAAKTIMMLIAEGEYGIDLEIMPYDEATYLAMTAYESSTTEPWPSDLITSTFSETFNATLPSFCQESIFSSTLYYTGTELTPWIQLNSDQATLVDLRTYVASLFDANWSLDMMEDEMNGVYAYLLVDPTQSVLMVIHFSDGYMPFLSIDFTHYSESIYQDVYETIFPVVPM